MGFILLGRDIVEPLRELVEMLREDKYVDLSDLRKRLEKLLVSLEKEYERSH